MTYTAYDPREYIRQTVGTSKYLYDNDYYCVYVTDNNDDTVYIPLLFPYEARTQEMFPMPFIELTMVVATGETHNIGGDVRRDEFLIDFNLYFTETDNITPQTFEKSVLDYIYNKIVTNRYSISTCTFIEPMSSREILELDDNKEVVFHYVITCRSMRYQKS